MRPVIPSEWFVMQFSVLASGSSGNASLVFAEGFGVLLDLGLGPRALAQRLAQVHASWDDVRAALLTHLHGDHWNEATLNEMARRGLPLHCHACHAARLLSQSPAAADLDSRGLFRIYELNREHDLGPNWRFVPFPLRHDAGVTCGFRLEGARDIFGRAWSLAYAADLGSWDGELVSRLADVDILALEFNHDEEMERQSDRSRFLVHRVLGEQGHLSNRQAAELLRTVLAQSPPGRLRHLVQLHLSRQCNRPELAQAAAQQVLAGHDVQVHTARQEEPAPPIRVRFRPQLRRNATRLAAVSSACQPWLPGWD